MIKRDPQENQEKSDSDKEDSSCYQDSENFDNKHQSEVYANKEYYVVVSSGLESLRKRVQNMMNSEWKPQGGIAVEHLPKSEGYADVACFYYQAMVRGL